MSQQEIRPEKHEKHAVKATLSVTLIVFVSKAIGFLRDIVTTNYFGTTPQYDAYTAAYSLYFFPILLFTSCITSTLIPMYLEARRNEGALAADQYASNSINLFAMAALAVSIVMYLLAEPISRVVYARFDEDRLQMTIQMTRIMLPSLVFVVVSVVQSSIMNARERYFAGQLSGFPYSILTIIAAVCFATPFGIKAVAWATAIAGLMQMLVIIPFHRGIFKYSVRFHFAEPRIKRMLILAAPSMASMAVNEVNHMFDQFMTSGLNKGDMSAMSYGWRLITFILGVVTVPIITVMFSRMSKHAADKNHQAIIDIVMQCLEAMYMILLPIIVVAGVMGLDLVKMLFMRGKFDLTSAQATASIFVMYLLGTIFFGMRDLLNRAFHSIQITRTPLYNSFLTMTVNIIGNIVLSKYLGASGLALSTTISCGIGVVLLFWLLRKRLGPMHGCATLIELSKVTLAGLIALAAVLALDHIIPETVGTFSIFIRILSCGVPSLLIYLGALFALKVKQLSFIRQIIKR